MGKKKSELYEWLELAAHNLNMCHEYVAQGDTKTPFWQDAADAIYGAATSVLSVEDSKRIGDILRGGVWR